MNIFESLQDDSELMNELYKRLKNDTGFPTARKMGISSNEMAGFMEGMPLSEAAHTLEAVVLDFLRPCLIIKNNSYSLPESDVWKLRLEAYRKMLEHRIKSVGRIEFKYHPRHKWGGTGWLIAENIIITNRHVAALFAQKSAAGITFIRNPLGTFIEAFIDYNEENQSSNAAIESGVEEILYLADDGLPDISILKISPTYGKLEPIPIFMGQLKAKSEIAVVGYPAYDPYRNPLKPADVTRIFSDIFECKRLSPGLVLNELAGTDIFSHDATTLGGNSGSVVLDLKSGQAAGLHFSGVFHEENFAVTGRSILDALAKTSVLVKKAKIPLPLPEPIDYEVYFDEVPLEDYLDKPGYQEDFLGEGNIIPLPPINDDANILTFGDGETELKYLHFSVVMNAERRMCFYSAVNVFGRKYFKTKRPGWRYDPRIPKEYQIKGECYGNYPKYSRGHMTRREDPAWGANLEEATMGNADSMHVTNVVPQVQLFNAGIWLELEEYALQNAKEDEMKITVITGPYFSDDDREDDGVRIPKEFWKIIVFIHDETGELCATGYTMSQESFLQPQEFVYGEFKTYQTTIRSIQLRAGINFGGLLDLDPYANEEVVASPLMHISQIKFRK